MSPSRRAKAVALAALVLAAPASRAAVRLEVGGRAIERGGRLEVTLSLTNRGDQPTGPVDVEGELLGFYEEARLDPGPPAGGAADVKLRFPIVEDLRPGVHPVALHLRYTPAGVPTVQQRAYLLLALGANPDPAVRLFVSPARLDTLGRLSVGIESADGQAHRVRVRVLAPRGINPFGPSPEVEVPAQGRVETGLELLRGTATRPSRQGLVVLAGVIDGPLERTSVALGEVEVLPDPARLPPLRWPLGILAVLLLAAGVAVEVWRRR